MSYRKRELRQKEVADEFAEHLLKSSQQAVLSSKSDDELFIFDRQGSTVGRKRALKLKDAISRGSPISITEKNLIEKVNLGKSLLSRNSIVNVLRSGDGELELKDIWNNAEDSSTNNQSDSLNRKKKKLEIARPGQSYNPSTNDHQDAIAEALALELKKTEAESKLQIAWGNLDTIKQFEEPNAVNNGADEDEENDGEDSSGVEKGETDHTLIRNKMKPKLTKAQRNKMKLRKEKDYEKSQKELEKNILKSIDIIPNILKEIEESDKMKEMKSNIRKLTQQADKREFSSAYEEAGTIPLSDELKGSLRLIHPRGGDLKDQVRRLQETGELFPKNRRKRRLRENPHAAKKVKWVAKYKY